MSCLIPYCSLNYDAVTQCVEAEIGDKDSRGNDEVAHDELENTEGWDEVLIDDEEDNVEMVLECD